MALNDAADRLCDAADFYREALKNPDDFEELKAAEENLIWRAKRLIVLTDNTLSR